MKVFYHIPLISVFFLSIVSCGKGELENSNIDDIEPGSLMTLKSSLSESEINGFRNICLALRSKRLKLQSVTISPTNEFSLKETNCEKERQAEKVANFKTFIGSSNVPEYLFLNGVISDSYDTDIQTDQSGYLKSICSEIVDNDKLNKSDAETSFSVITYPSVHEVEFISFSSPNKFLYAYGRNNELTLAKRTEIETHRAQLSEDAQKDSFKSEYTLIRKIEFAVEMNQNDDYYGFIESVQKSHYCVNKKFSVLRQDIKFE